MCSISGIFRVREGEKRKPISSQRTTNCAGIVETHCGNTFRRERDSRIWKEVVETYVETIGETIVETHRNVTWKHFVETMWKLMWKLIVETGH